MLRTRLAAGLLAALLALSTAACANGQQVPDTDNATESGG